MPSGWDRRLALLGGLLPRRMREYVFEPACYDLMLETLEQRRDARLLTPRLIGILLHVAVVNFPRVLFDGGRPSRLAMVIGSVLGVSLLGLVSLAIAMRGAYGP